MGSAAPGLAAYLVWAEAQWKFVRKARATMPTHHSFRLSTALPFFLLDLPYLSGCLLTMHSHLGPPGLPNHFTNDSSPVLVMRIK